MRADPFATDLVILLKTSELLLFSAHTERGTVTKKAGAEKRSKSFIGTESKEVLFKSCGTLMVFPVLSFLQFSYWKTLCKKEDEPGETYLPTVHFKKLAARIQQTFQS